MYRIKLGSGDESVFNSFEELSFGIGTGIIGPDAQIFHDTAEKWLPVTVHPAYKKAIAATPPPDPTSGNGRNGHHNPSPGSEPHAAQTDVDEGGMDLLTLLDLEELAEFGPRKVQDSAATQDSAEPLAEIAEPEPEADFEQESPEPDEVSGFSSATDEELPISEASEDEDEDDGSWAQAPVEVFSDPEEAEADEAEAEETEPVAGFMSTGPEVLESELDSVEQDVVDESYLDLEDEPDDSDEEEPEPSQPPEILDDSATEDDVATQALDSEIDEPPVAKLDEGASVFEAGETQVDEDVHDADDAYVDEVGDDEEDGAIESVADAVVESQIEDVEDDEADEDEEVADAPEMEAAEFEEDEEDSKEELAEPESDTAFDEVEDETLSSVDSDEADEYSDEANETEAEVEAVEEEALGEDYADETPVPAGASAEEEYDPIAAFESDMDELAADSLPTITGRLPGANKKRLVVVAVAAGLIGVAGLAWMLNGSGSGQDGENPGPGSVTPVAAATVGPRMPSVAVAPVTDSSARDTAPNTAELQQQYEEGYARAQVRFDDALRRAGFVRVFVASRFASPEDMGAVRSAVRNAGRALSDYSLREGAIEGDYADADPSLRETRANRELAEDLLAVTDRLYGLLLGNLEAYAVRAGAITITDDAVEAEYVRLRGEVDRLVILASNIEDGTKSASVSRIAAGIGTTRPLPLSTLAPAPVIPQDLTPGG